MPAAFETHPATPAELRRAETEQKAWWAAFGDPVLDGLVEQAIAGNLQLRAQAQRIIAARAMRNEERAAFFPQIDVMGLAAEQHFSTTLEFPPLAGVSSFNRLWQGGPELNWELDVFGRIRRSVQAADAELDATVEQRRGVLVSLLAELADQYATLRATQLRLSIAEANVRIAEQGLVLVQRLYRQGIGTTLQVAQAQSQLETQQAALPQLRTAIDRATHAIGILTGSLPERFTTSLTMAAPVPAVPALPATLPSIVLANRPDIRQAERRYAAAVARIGVAVADLYPRFTVPLYAYPQSSMIHEFFASASLAWQLALSTTIPVYTGGRLRNQVVAARAEAEEARLAYEQTVLQAFGEVEDALSAYRDDAVREERLRRAAADSRLAFERAETLFSHGLTGYLDVLTAERTVVAAEDAAALGTLVQLQDAVALFRAIGAGWQGVDWTDATLPVPPAVEQAAARAAPLALQAR